MKNIIKKLIPQILIDKLKMILAQIKSIGVKKIFNQANISPAWLTLPDLETLQQKYPYPPEYGYDQETLEKRGAERANEVLNFLNKKTKNANQLKSFLELGCWDGMVSCALQLKGKQTTAVDIRGDGFDQRAIKAGVTLKPMDATKLEFADQSFDVSFCFDAFEHFSDPEKVLREMIRVTKTNGYIFMYFDPLYMSAMGLHAYRSITVPYCQFLWPKEILQSFATSKKLAPINFDKINERTLEDYRGFWQKYSKQLKKIFYQENYNTSYLELIAKYPTCFKSKTNFFDNLIVSGIKVLFQKTSDLEK